MGIRLKLLEISNLCRYSKKMNRIEFDKFGDLIFILGRVDGDRNKSIGAGKTSIFRIITWVLFNDFVEDISKGDFLRYGKDEGYGRLELYDGEHNIIIERHIGKTNRLKVFVDGKDKTKRLPTLTQKWINKYIGIDFLTWRNSVLRGQEEKNKLLSGTDKERKEVFGKFIGDDKLDEWLQKVRRKKSDVLMKVNKYEGKVEAYSDWYRKGFLSEHKRKAYHYAERIRSLEEKCSGMLEEKKKINESNESIQNRMKEIDAKINRSYMASCVFDSTVLSSKGHEKSILEDIRKLRNRQKKLFQTEICDFCFSRVDGKIVRNSIDEKISVLADKIKKVKKERAASKSKYENCKSEEKKLKEKYDRLNLRLKKFNTDKLGIIKDRIARYKFVRSRILRDIKLYKEKKMIINKLSKKLDVLNRKQNLLNQADEIFGLYGFRVDRLSKILPSIEERINYYLSKTTDDDLYVKLIAKKKFDIQVYQDGRISKWAAYSGGEKNLIAAVTHIVMGEMIADKKFSFDFMLLDEIFIGLDINHIDKLLELLNELARKKGIQIFIITNQRMIIDLYKPKDVILVKKNRGVSRINHE